ncbi:hypothetical protein DFP72DRAFT_847939 [Ephemerocybe angulata]|uniref:Uncharacterized protein n=1 Tax=Ephemerocybe angulata TaxID=980116 RepID=A0A8H6HXD2_9AGAR|nr:hypothetical protein DFP72DRAFT_847939 [Tulosesus angulatus]
MSSTYLLALTSRRRLSTDPIDYLEQLPMAHINALLLILHRRNTAILAKASDLHEEAAEEERRAELDLLARMSRALLASQLLEGSHDGAFQKVQEKSEKAEMKYCLALRRWRDSRRMVADARADMCAMGEREMEDAFYSRVLSIEREFGILYREADEVTGPGPSLDDAEDDFWTARSDDGDEELGPEDASVGSDA